MCKHGRYQSRWSSHPPAMELCEKGPIRQLGPKACSAQAQADAWMQGSSKVPCNLLETPRRGLLTAACKASRWAVSRANEGSSSNVVVEALDTYRKGFDLASRTR